MNFPSRGVSSSFCQRQADRPGSPARRTPASKQEPRLILGLLNVFAQYRQKSLAIRCLWTGLKIAFRRPGAPAELPGVAGRLGAASARAPPRAACRQRHRSSNAPRRRDASKTGRGRHTELPGVGKGPERWPRTPARPYATRVRMEKRPYDDRTNERRGYGRGRVSRSGRVWSTKLAISKSIFVGAIHESHEPPPDVES
jgi:hypothetical protein